ncbi:hypothetical protein FB45DRAFT_124292, partial [Roridomyces roridus]
DAHRLGSYWSHVPECEDRAVCAHCGVPEDLEHVLIRCARPGQAEVWAMAESLWLKKHPVWPALSLGGILGCGLIPVRDEEGRVLQGASRLYRILISESLFLIWKIRNESTIQRDGSPLSSPEIHNRWNFAINQRHRLDILLSRARNGQRAKVSPGLVLHTWSSVLRDEDSLPNNWLDSPRVLVGIERRDPSPPSPRPSGRLGRNR